MEDDSTLEGQEGAIMMVQGVSLRTITRTHTVEGEEQLSEVVHVPIGT